MIVAYYFTADWCAPCKKTKPIVEEINKDGAIKFQIIDVDSSIDLVRAFEIKSVPTFIIIKDAEIVKRSTGAQNYDELIELLNV